MRPISRSVLAAVLAVSAVTGCSTDGDSEPDVEETTIGDTPATDFDLPNSTVEDGVPEDNELGSDDGEQ